MRFAIAVVFDDELVLWAVTTAATRARAAERRAKVIFSARTEVERGLGGWRGLRVAGLEGLWKGWVRTASATGDVGRAVGQ
jgi:hypothetical protein